MQENELLHKADAYQLAAAAKWLWLFQVYSDKVMAGQQTNIAPQFDKTKPLEGIDYYMEKGKWVFTEWFHLKRGDCCGRGCRHCPYDHKNVLN